MYAFALGNRIKHVTKPKPAWQRWVEPAQPNFAHHHRTVKLGTLRWKSGIPNRKLAFMLLELESYFPALS